MKKLMLAILMAWGLSYSAKAQEQEVQQLLLNVEKLAQLKNILEDLKKGYEIVFQGYTTIKNISEGNFKLHDLFLDGLLKVSPAVRKYKPIAHIIAAQIQIVKEQKTAFRQFSASGLLTDAEMAYVNRVYTNLLKQTIGNLDALTMVLTDSQLRMSDDERLNAIDGIWKNVQESVTFLRHFNSESKMLLLQRTKDKANLATIKQLYK